MDDEIYREKYLKYKNKYLDLKKQSGGDPPVPPVPAQDQDILAQVKQTLNNMATNFGHLLTVITPGAAQPASTTSGATPEAAQPATPGEAQPASTTSGATPETSTPGAAAAATPVALAQPAQPATPGATTPAAPVQPAQKSTQETEKKKKYNHL